MEQKVEFVYSTVCDQFALMTPLFGGMMYEGIIEVDFEALIIVMYEIDMAYGIILN